MSSSEEAIFAIVYLIVYFFLMAYGVFAYIGVSLGGFRMGRKVWMSKPWLFWIPGCNIYALGRLADTGCLLQEYRSTNYRKKLLVWFLISVGAAIEWCVSLVSVALLSYYAEQVRVGSIIHHRPKEVEALVIPVLLLLLLTVVLIAVYIVYMVFYFIALHKIYKLYAPDGAAGLTVLSILVSAAIPVIFLVLSGRSPAVAVLQSRNQAPPADPRVPASSGKSFYSL
ncbi:MAG: hypothetical protein J6B24_14570 [Clostridia bacterium]|nr:hypothetical protein [Clostridia bacterium]